MNKTKTLKREIMFWGLGLALMIPVITGCENAGAVAGTDSAAIAVEAVRPVRAIRLEKPMGVCVRSFPGRAKAVREVNLAFRVAGPLVELNGDTGDKVTKGDLIARIDPRDFSVQVKTLEATLNASQAQVTESKLQYARYTNLIQENAAAKATYDQVKAAFEMADARAKADRKNLEAARNALGDTILISPFTGYINRKLVENYETVSLGQVIVSLVDLSSMEVQIGIPEDLISQAGRFKNYSCEFESIPGKKFTAVLKEVGKNPNLSNQTYPLSLILNPKEISAVRPGMSARVTFTIDGEDQTGEDQDAYFQVPAQSIVNDDQHKTFVWIVGVNKKVHKQYVKTAGFSNSGVEVRGELNAGDWLVTAGASFLKEGQTTRILQAAATTNVGNAL